MKTLETDYTKQATDFLIKCNTTITVKFIKNDFHFPGDKDKRDIYEIELKRGNRIATFIFGQSLNDSGFYYQYISNKRQFPLDRKYLSKDYFKGKSFGLVGTIKMNDGNFNPKIDTIHYPVAPNAYDLLASITKYEVGTFEDFCGEYGYDEDSRTAEKTYNAVKEEYLKVISIFNESEIEELQEIQ